MIRDTYWPKFNECESEMDVLVKLSRHYGGDPAFVLAGGGNTSYKDANVLYVKASGFALGSIGPEGFVALKRDALEALGEADLGAEPDLREERFKEGILAARCDPEKGLRPSVECVLHNLMPGTFVVHTHPTLVNGLTCCRQGRQLAEEMFGDDVLWIEYTNPGHKLARAVADTLAEWRARTGREGPEAILLENHGLIVSGDDPETLGKRTDRIVEAIEKRLASAPAEEVFGQIVPMESDRARKLIETIAPALRGLLADGENLKIVTFDDSKTVLSLAATAEGKQVAALGPMIPDQIVYCCSFPLWFAAPLDDSPEVVVEELRRAVGEHVKSTGFAPKVVLVAGVGMFSAGDDIRTARIAGQYYSQSIKLMSFARRLGGIRAMSKPQREFIENWEAEAHRKKVLLQASSAGRVAGKVAFVTGAAQGFGLEIARGLAREGAHVALADINRQGAEDAARRLNDEFGKGRALAVRVDVTDGESVANAVHRTIRTYGGLDVLISNAGVLKAESVKTQPEADFDFVTRVNYKGYFLCVQKACPAMAVQHLAKPNCRSDIIQINSKSGLAGSNRNFAYAGGKFGGIGLTQSFALELITDGIKVNAVCPGNFFDGPLWSDPENGLFVQYLRTGKVPGAKTVEDVRRAYEQKVPMGRGCTAEDVMKAIYYLIEQQYETGQALAVTGGQVMLH